MADSESMSVRYFAAAADASGCRSETLALPHSSTLADLVAVLSDKYGPDMKRVLSVSAYLVGEELTRDTGRVAGPAVDILPPFAGG
ncbi:MoaD/ThiS family protein [Rhodococcus sp. ACPA4]|uniref:MoaD/ThiS family protein n=1 Tax=Rhodococcus TaxID=1827 RepID=UPI0009B8A7D7|nr:MoaD/ThiS family protein [Rhodococcus sp. MS16]PBC44361.1 MoaD/ThiS family protein [Rhodococcus sp. ACPA4]PSR43597.1 MoaD/ThiS family protein [Rhodococcus sp. AD45-ID]RZL23893.1 MAG: MoaD/ThiS family protein [Rhodococcus sp. (in: high G+C Gram-positive bacteria)]